jgi:hypothetical protein
MPSRARETRATGYNCGHLAVGMTAILDIHGPSALGPTRTSQHVRFSDACGG